MNERLADAWAKHAWAKRHVDHLKQAITDSEPHLLTLKLEYTRLTPQNLSEFMPPGETIDPANPPTDENIGDIGAVSVIADARPTPPEIGLFLGDALNNFRAALDYAAWALVRVGKKPNLSPEAAQQVQFPIRLEQNHWKSVCGQRIPGVRDPALRVVYEHQPFRRKQDAQRHPLRRLADLGSKDKHRRLTVATAANTWGRYAVHFPPAFGFMFQNELGKDADLVQPGDCLSYAVGAIHGDGWQQAKLVAHDAIGGLWVPPHDHVESAIDAISTEVEAILTELDPPLRRSFGVGRPSADGSGVCLPCESDTTYLQGIIFPPR